jgi:pilus assembly protein CpaB
MGRRKVLLVVAVVVAAMGAALVFVYARGAEDRAAEKFATVDVLVVKTAIERGESANAAYETGKIDIQKVPRAQVLAGATSDGGVFTDQFALTTIYPGEQLIPEKFGGADEVEAESTLPIPEGKIAISVNLSDTARVGSFIRPGAKVGVFLTGTLPPENTPTTKLLMRDVLVLATGSTTAVAPEEEAEGAAEGTPPEELPNTLFTLALTQQQAEKILFAQSLGELALALLNENSNLKPGDGAVATDLFEEE